MAEYEQIAVRRKHAQLTLVVWLVGGAVDVAVRLFVDHVEIRVVNDRHIVTMYTRAPGGAWTRYGVRIEVSGYNHNTAWDFLSLRPAIYCAGQGEARIRNVTYRAL